MSFVTFKQAADIADGFLDLLAAMDIDPLNKGRIEAEFLSTIELLDAWSKALSTEAISEDVQRTAAGVHDFAAKVLAATKFPEFDGFRDHLELIARGDLQTSISQMEEGYPEDISRKLVELYVACLAIHSGTNVKLDHPVKSKGDNPDVMLDYRGLRWAIAIKATSSRQGQTLFENIKKAASQIDQSAADSGLILINLRDSIDHKSLQEENYGSVAEAMDALKAELMALGAQIEHDRPASDWDPVFAAKAKPPVLLMAQAMAFIPTCLSPKTPTPIKIILAHSFRQAADNDALELANALNHFMQTVLQGQPGPPPF